jgi:hypothetical protein
MDALVGGGNAILLLLTVFTVIVASVVAFLAYRRNNRRLVRIVAGFVGLIVIGYGALLLIASATSSERTLTQGDVKWFCGFYLDCHLGLSVDGVETATSITSPAGPVTASGMFHNVQLRLHNSARNPAVNMTLYEPVAHVVDASGHEYPRATVAEHALASTSTSVKPLPREMRVTHEPAYATLVFDLPTDVQEPRLLITDGWVIDRALEFVLINDENSIFHPKTLLALEEGTPGEAAHRRGSEAGTASIVALK